MTKEQETAAVLIRGALASLCNVPDREAAIIAIRVVEASATLTAKPEDRRLLEAEPQGRA
jgi:hypothetical protein